MSKSGTSYGSGIDGEIDELFKEAVSLGVINDENIMEGIEVDIRIAKALAGLNRGRKTNKKNSPKVR